MLDDIVAVLVLATLPAALAAAAMSDFLTMKISNRLSLALVASFFVLAPLVGLPLVDLGMSFLAALIVFAVCFTLFAMNVMGGGDAKLLTAATLWFGLTSSLLTFLVLVAYIGGGVTLLFLLLRARADFVMSIGVPLPVSVVSSKKIPYGIAIALGGLLAFGESPVAILALKAF